MPAKWHTIVLCVMFNSHSAPTGRKTWSFILFRIHISVLCVVNDSSPGIINSDTWRVMLGTIRISVLCVTKNSSPETTHRDTIQVMLWFIHIHIKEFISINHPKRHINIINRKLHITVLFNIQEPLQKIFSFGNVIGGQNTSWEYPATQSLQHTIRYCWWKLVINYLCSTNFV